jgi:hypothetical protein
MAGQGKVGAVEMKDLAKYGGRLAAASQAFGGNAGQNLGDMGALAQLSVARGGASSAAEAATSVAGFANTLKTPARVKEFKAHGVDIFAKGGGFKSVLDILKDSSSAAVERGGTEAPLEFKKMFANVKGGQSADPAFQAYIKAFRASMEVTKSKTKADEAGKKAIDELFDSFGKAISENEEKESFDRSMKTGAAQVQLFNNKMSEIGGQIAGRVLPQLQKLSPFIVSAVEAFAKVVTYAAENPGNAIAAAVVASIAKAAIGTAVTSGINSLLTNASAVKGMNAISIVAGSIAIASVGMIAIDSLMNEIDKGTNKSLEQDIKATDAILGGRSALREVETTGNDQKDLQAVAEKRREQAAALEEARAQQTSIKERISNIGEAGNLFNVIGGDKTFGDVGRGMADADKTDQLAADYKALSTVIQNLTAQLGKPLTVKGEVNVSGAAPGPTANLTNTTK